MSKVIGVTTGSHVASVRQVSGSERSVTVVSGQNRLAVASAGRGSEELEAVTGIVAGVTKQYVDEGDAAVKAHSDSEDERVLAEAKAYADRLYPYLVQSYIDENRELLKGDDGEPFYIYKTYPSINDMQLDYENIPYGKFVIVSSEVGDADNGKVYQRGLFGWDFIVAMASIQGPQGEKGEKGDTGEKGEQGEPGSDATVTADAVAEALGYTPANPADIPTKVSAFENDAGYLTAHQSLADYYTAEQVDALASTKLDQSAIDAVNAAVAKKADASAVYTKNQVDDALAGKLDAADVPVVPDKVSAFENDAGYITLYDIPGMTAADIAAILGYTPANAASVPAVPTKVSAFENDAGYITAAGVPEVSSSSIIAALGYTPADSADIPYVPSRLSELDDDVGYLTSHQSLADYYTKSQVDAALADKADAGDIPTVPTKVSELSNDIGYLTAHQPLTNYYTKSQVQNQISSAVSAVSADWQDAVDAERTARQAADDSLQSAVTSEVSARTSAVSDLQDAVNLKADASDVYTQTEVDSLLNAISSTLDSKAFYSDLPKRVSELSNDVGYITVDEVPEVSSSSIIAALGYTPADSADLVSAYVYKGSVAAYANLPTTGNKAGDVWNVAAANGSTPAGTNYAWTGSAWDALGGTVDLSGYVPTSRTVNGKALTGNITLSASDVGALASGGTASAASKLATARTLWGQSFDGSANVSGAMSSVGQITFSDIAAGSTANLLYGKMATNDCYRILAGGESNAGYLEIATADDGNEPVYVRQYSGVFATLKRTLTLLDGSGNSDFPGTVSAAGFTGNLTGNASTATSATTASKLGTANVGDANTPIYLNAGVATSTGKSFASYMPWMGNKRSTVTKGTAPTATVWDWSAYVLQAGTGTAEVDRLAEIRHYVGTNLDSYFQIRNNSAVKASENKWSSIQVGVNAGSATYINLNAESIIAKNGSTTTLGHTLNMKDSTYNQVNPVIRVYTDNDSAHNYGLDVVYGANGATYVAGGEAGVSLRNTINDHSENVHIAADGEVNIWNGCNTIANRIRTRYTSQNVYYYPAENLAIARGTAPAANWNKTFAQVDKDANVLSRLVFQYNTAKRHGVYLEPLNDSGTASGLLGIFMDAAGTAAYTQAPTPGTSDSSTKIATTAYVKANVPKSVGSATKGVYTNANGVVTAMTYELNKTVPADAVFTDTTYDSMKGATASAAGTAGLVPASAAGDQAKVLSAAGTWVTNTGDTHWTTTMFAGAKDAKSNAATTNGNAYLKLYDNNTVRAQLNIKGTGATTVTTDANGVITINSTDNNTTYSNFVKSGTGAAAGLVPSPGTTAGTSKYLREDGTWQVPPNTSPGAGGAATFATAKGTAPASNQYHEHISYDNTGKGSGTAYRFALVGRFLSTANLAAAYLTAYDPTSAATKAATVGVYYPAGGTAYTAAPTPATTDSSTKIATTAYVKACVPKSVGNANTPVYTDKDGKITSTGKSFANYVPTSRTVNGKALTGNITLSAGDLTGFFPDYSSVTTLADNASYTLNYKAPSNGYFIYCGMGTTAFFEVNGIKVAQGDVYSGSGWTYGPYNCFLPMKKGAVIKSVNSSGASVSLRNAYAYFVSVD